MHIVLAKQVLNLVTSDDWSNFVMSHDMSQLVKTGLMKTRDSRCFTSETASVMSYVAGLYDALHVSVFIVAQIISFNKMM